MCGDEQRAGLCARCRWARTVSNRRGSRFWLCGRAEADPAYPKYPRLPVRACPGFEERGAAEENEIDRGR